MPTRGIDISHWNQIDNWEVLGKELRATNGFIIVKAGGNEKGKHYIDAALERNMEKIYKYFIPYGLYYFTGGQVNSAMAGRTAAVDFLDIILKVDCANTPMGYWCDYEMGMSKTRAGNTDAVINFCNCVKRETGKECGIYGSDIFTFKNMLDSSRLKDYRKWVAKYSSKAPEYITDWYIWQHSSTGRVPGIYGNVDLNVMHDF